jgi:CubicO group peptidase (beta-lactamase class C family)
VKVLPFDKNHPQEVSVHLSAILPPPTSQLPEEQQYKQWGQQHRDRCGVKLRAIMDWGGLEADAPMNPHFETALVQEGGGDYVKTPRGTPICDGAQCVTTCEIAENIRQELDGHTVGYSFFVGPDAKFGSHGFARTLAEGPPRPFTPTTKITVASVSKMVTAIAAVRILDKSGGVGIDSTIDSRLPSIWSAGGYVKKLKFSKLLSQSSGIMDYGNVSQEYISLKTFFSQPVSDVATTLCHNGKAGKDATKSFFNDPINPNNLERCYSNYNFSIFRILLPRVAGLPEDPNLVTQPKTLANQYVKLVQQNVFDLVGQEDVDCKPPSQGPAASSYALAYRFPGTQPGQDWGDLSLQCGAAGWYLSVQDIAKVLASINAKDGKILAETGGKQQFELMRTRQLGWDVDTENELEKNGGFVADCDKDGEHCKTISTSIAIFGPVKGPRVTAALFMNSDISGGPSDGKGAAEVLKKAYDKALLPKP